MKCNGSSLISIDELLSRPAAWTPELEGSLNRFYVVEAALQDIHHYREWLNLFTDDTEYWAPLRTNTLLDEGSNDTDGSIETGLFLDSKQTLGWRVTQFETGRHWAEDPPSRTRHLITNMIIVRADAHTMGSFEVVTNFLVYRNRLESEVDIWVGARRDELVATQSGLGFLIRRRTVLLDQAAVLSKNLSVFF